jgi:acetyl esterase/lipase
LAFTKQNRSIWHLALTMLRLIFLCIFFLASLLTIFKAPAYYLWLLGVMVSEYSMIFIAVTLLLLSVGWKTVKYKLAGTVVGVMALLLFLSPIIRAFKVGAGLKEDIEKAFLLCGVPVKSTFANNPAFNFSRLFYRDKKADYKSLTYVTYPDTSLTLDFYRSAKSGARPCVVVIHGGSWSSGDSQQLPELNGELAMQGYQVASINYRLAPKWQSPAPLQDVTAALSYLHEHADELHIDTTQFILLGRSAGAQIALLAAYTIKGKGIKAVIDFYGPADMVWGYSIPAPKLVMDSRRVMANYLGGYYPKVPQNYKASSPIEFVTRESVPTLLIHGQNDVLVAYEHSQRLAEKLKQNAVPHCWLQLPWATHGFDHHLNGPGGQLSTFAVERFLEQVVK